MPIKSILVPISAAEFGRATLETAFQVARRFDAHIEVLHVRSDPRSLVPYTGEGMDGSMIEEIMEVTEREGGERASRTRRMFDEFCTAFGVTAADTPRPGAGVTIAWREELGREDEVVALAGRMADLLVLGRPVRDSALPSPITLEAALLDTGRPVLVAPPAPLADAGSRVAIAWEASPEAARAIADAMPLLKKAEKVTVMVAHVLANDPPGPNALLNYLTWHDVRADLHRFESTIGDLGASYLAESKKVGANLMVKGAYSQSRLRQMIFGGRTKHILAHAEIPVLLSHC